jgi:N-sulfoglucosamine sulfohydrolase
MRFSAPVLFAATGALFATAAVARATPAATRPDIVLIVTDDQGRDSLGCYGNPVIKTPHLDRLAADATRFEFAFASASSCSPNRSVLLTGRHHFANGQFGLAQKPHNFSSYADEKSLPNLLRAAGYRTARVGKYHVAPESAFAFETAVPGDANDPVAMAENSRAVIAAKDTRPFFLYFCTTAPHVGGGRAEELPFQPNRFYNKPEGYAGTPRVTYRPEDVIVPPYLPDIPEMRAELAQYYEAVSRADAGVGRLVEILQAAGRYDNTLLIFLSDNGHALPMAKATLYDAGIHLPLIVRAPGQRARGLVSRAMVGFTDVAPTILDFSGVAPAPANLHGRSFRAILERPDAAGWDEIYAGHTFHEARWYYPARAVRERRFKLIRNLAHPLENPAARTYHPTWQAAVARGLATYGRRPLAACLHQPEFELYDLAADPDEVRNLAADTSHRAEFERLRAKLAAFQWETRDPWGTLGEAPPESGLPRR